MVLLPSGYCWHCLEYTDWFWFSLIWDSSAPTHAAVHDVAMQLACTLSGMEYKGERFETWRQLYGLIEHETGLPFPFDHYWAAGSDMWWEMGAQYDIEGPADWDQCLLFKFPGDQGGAWPVRWPTE